MHLLFALLVACSGDDPEPNNTDTDTDTDTGTVPPLTVDSATGDTGPSTDTDKVETATTAVTGTTGTTGDTGNSSVGIDLTGRTYRFTPTSLNIVRPGIPLYIYDTVFLVEIIEHDMVANTIDLRVANWDIYGGGGQNACAPTVDILDVDLSTAPVVSFGPVDGSVSYVSLRFPVEEAFVELTFDALYEEVTDSSIEALFDTSVAATAYGGPNYYCNLLLSYGAGGCTVCPSTGDATCVPWEANSARARWDPALAVVERTQVDVQTDPACP